MPNYARKEVEAMCWPEEIADPLGDAERENVLLRRKLHIWRWLAAFGFFLLALSWTIYFYPGERMR
jgi:hypothetical protein